MRPVGFAVLVIAAGLGNAASSPVQSSTVGGIPQPAQGADPARLATHLGAWEKASAARTNFFVEVGLTRKDAVRQKPQDYSGSALCMRPAFARMRLEYKTDPNDYEAFICNGKAVYVYSGLAKTVTEHKLPDPKANPAAVTDNLILDFLFGMKAKDIQERFEVKLIGEDETYVYVDVKPLLAKDKLEFRQLRLALFGPSTKSAYLPAQIKLVKQNEDTEEWRFTNPKMDNPGINAKQFEYDEVKDFRFQRAHQPGPSVRPTQPIPPK